MSSKHERPLDDINIDMQVLTKYQPADASEGRHAGDPGHTSVQNTLNMNGSTSYQGIE